MSRISQNNRLLTWYWVPEGLSFFNVLFSSNDFVDDSAVLFCFIFLDNVALLSTDRILSVGDGIWSGVELPGDKILKKIITIIS
jgi:hypothetical protein